MTLQERLQKRRHEEHQALGVKVQDGCPLCPQDTRPGWRRQDLSRDLTGGMFRR